MPKNEGYINKEDYLMFDDEKRWGYIESLHKLIGELKIQADKNCEECEKSMLDEHDINIDYHFEDWRDCSKYCDECSKEDRINMCALQFEIINHIANSLAEVKEKHNALFKIIMRKDEYTKKILDRFQEAEELSKKKSEGLFS